MASITNSLSTVATVVSLLPPLKLVVEWMGKCCMVCCLQCLIEQQILGPQAVNQIFLSLHWTGISAQFPPEHVCGNYQPPLSLPYPHLPGDH